MTTKQLSFQAPINVAIAAGATSPNPGSAGVGTWSTTTNSTVEWDGTKWNVVAVDDLLAWEPPVPSDAWGVSFVYPFSATANAGGARKLKSRIVIY